MKLFIEAPIPEVKFHNHKFLLLGVPPPQHLVH